MADGDTVKTSGGSSGLERLIEIGLALSAERNHDRLTEMILLEAMDITNADGGTLYLRTHKLSQNCHGRNHRGADPVSAGADVQRGNRQAQLQ